MVQALLYPCLNLSSSKLQMMARSLSCAPLLYSEDNGFLFTELRGIKGSSQSYLFIFPQGLLIYQGYQTVGIPYFHVEFETNWKYLMMSLLEIQVLQLL